jgi:hypothetical protein
MARVFDEETPLPSKEILSEPVENPAEDSDSESKPIPSKALPPKKKTYTKKELAVKFLSKQRDLLIGYFDIRYEDVKSSDDVIKIANELAQKMAESKYMKDNGNPGGYVDFEGNTYCADGTDDETPPCLGWNGTDRRCHCGNRRVYWHYEGSFLDFAKNEHTIYPVAD